MRTIALRKTVLAFALGFAFGSSLATEGEGKRVDNGRIDLHGVPSPSERQSDIAYPLPSGVTRRDLEAMRAAHATLPASPAPIAQSLSDTLSGGAVFASGSANLTNAARQALVLFAKQIKGKSGIRLSVVGHTDDQRLSSRAKKLFGDNQGLSEARALAVADFLRREVNLPLTSIAISGQGDLTPVAGNGTNDGMARNRRVEVQVWHGGDETFPPSETKSSVSPPCAPVTRPVADAPFRVTVDGEPLDLNGSPLEADRQRCTDGCTQHCRHRCQRRTHHCSG